MNVVKKLEDSYIIRLDQLINEGRSHSVADAQYTQGMGSYTTKQAYSSIYGWLTSACVLAESIIGNDSNAYLVQLKIQLSSLSSYNQQAHIQAGSATKILEKLKIDIDAGLITNLKNKYTAEAFDDFLAHAESYYNENKKMEAGVIAGVVFEDTIRKIARKFELETDSQKLENLINALKSGNFIQKTKASRCKTAAAVRGTATHANWDDLDIGAVRDTISLTRELIGEFLEN